MKKISAKYLLIYVLFTLVTLNFSGNLFGQPFLSDYDNLTTTFNRRLGNQTLTIRINTVNFDNTTYFRLDGLDFRAWFFVTSQDNGVLFTLEGLNPVNQDFNRVEFVGLQGAITEYMKLYMRGYRSDQLNNGVSMINRNTGTFTDTRDGRIYKWVQMGNLRWMAENLAFLTPRNNIESENNLLPNGYFVYNFTKTSINDASNTLEYNSYGALYSWDAARNACPPGWHLPSDDEWKQLEAFLLMRRPNIEDDRNREGIVNGNQLKAPYGWSGLNNAFNPFGFSAIPGGFGDPIDGFNDIGNTCVFWSSSDFDDNTAWTRSLLLSEIDRNGNLDNTEIFRRIVNKSLGASVRCVR